MLKSEFESIAKRTVTDEQYDLIEGLYMQTELNKLEFVKAIQPLLKNIPEEKPITTVFLYEFFELVDVDIKTGITYIRKIPDREYSSLTLKLINELETNVRIVE